MTLWFHLILFYAILLFPKLTHCVMYATVNEHRSLKPLDVSQAEKDTNKAQRDVTAEERDSEEVKNKVIKEVVELKEKQHPPETPGEKSALAQKILNKEGKLLESAENEVQNAAESLAPLEASVKKDEVSAQDAAKKLGEAEAAIQEAQVIASVGTTMEKKLPVNIGSKI